jgi:hypothetical protein
MKTDRELKQKEKDETNELNGERENCMKIISYFERGEK